MRFDGQRLKDMREAKGFSLEDLGAVVGKTRQTVANWEKGDHEPSLEEIGKIGEALGVSGTFFIVKG